MQNFVGESVCVIMISTDEAEKKNLINVFEQHKINNPIHCADNLRDAITIVDKVMTESDEKASCVLLIDRLQVNKEVLEFFSRFKSSDTMKRLKIFVIDSFEGNEIPELRELNIAGLIFKPISFTSFVKGVSSNKLSWQLIGS